MINAKQYRKSNIPTIKLVICPACNKQRLTKYQDENGDIKSTSVESVTVREEERYLDACEFCVAKYKKSDDQFIMQNMRKLVRASKNGDTTDTDSTHKDFSLN